MMRKPWLLAALVMWITALSALAQVPNPDSVPNLATPPTSTDPTLQPGGPPAPPAPPTTPGQAPGGSPEIRISLGPPGPTPEAAAQAAIQESVSVNQSYSGSVEPGTQIDGPVAAVRVRGTLNGQTSVSLLIAVKQDDQWRIEFGSTGQVRGLINQPDRIPSELRRLREYFERNPLPSPGGARAASPVVAPAVSNTTTAAPGTAAPAPAPAAPPIVVSPQPTNLLSYWKPVLFLITFLAWAFVVSKLDKDLAANFFPRELWNGVQVIAGSVALLFWLFLPFFWLGWFVALLVMAGGILGYVFYRNPRVAESQRWEFSLETLQDMIQAKKQESQTFTAAMRMLNPNGTPREVPMADDPKSEAHAAMEELLLYALQRRAERIDLLADAEKTSRTVQIDGVKYALDPVPTANGLALIDYLKEHAGLDVADRRRRLSGQVGVDAGELGRHTVGVSTYGSTKGLVLSILVDRDKKLIPFNKLGLLEIQKQQLLAALDPPQRVVIVSAPPHQGMSTTLYALTNRHDAYTQSVVALEEEMEFELEGVTHEKIDSATDAAVVNQKLKATMLREAAVVLLPKIADADTAKIIAEYASQFRFYVGIHQDDTFNGLRAWMKILGSPKEGGRSVAAVISQRLVRKLCRTCRVPYKPDEAVLRKMNLTPDKVGQFYKHSGQVMGPKDEPQPCPDCAGLGYRGRLAVFEVMALDDDARALAAAGQLDQLRTHVRKNKMLWMQEAALAKVVEGETSISEITRVLGGER